MFTQPFDAILTKILVDFGVKETEQNWEKLEDGMKKAAEALQKESADSVVAGIRRIRDPLTSSLLTERTRLSSASMEFVRAASRQVGPGMDSLAELILPPLLKLCERSNKVFLQRAQQTLSEYIRVAPVMKSLMPRFVEAMKSSNKGLRGIVLECFELLFPLCMADAITEHGDVIEKFLADAMSDASPQVRETSRKCYALMCKTHAALAKKIFDRVPPPVQKLLNSAGNTSAVSGAAVKRTTSVAKSNAPQVQNKAPLNLPGRITGKPSHIGGAQRVLKTTESPGLTPNAKASRVQVPSHNGTPIKSGLRSCQSVGDTITASNTNNITRPTSSLATCVSAGQLALPGPSAATVRAEIVQAVSGARSSDWSVRNQSFERLFELLDCPESSAHIETSKAAAQRLFEALLVGLADTHFRVLESVVRFAIALLKCCSIDMLPDPNMPDNILAKTIYLSVNPQFKGKACQEEAPVFIELLRHWLGDPWKFCTCLSSAYSKAESTSSVKARVAIITRITHVLEHEIDLTAVPEQELLFNLKIIVSRITPALLDHDQALVQLAVAIFSTVHQKLSNESLLETLVLSVKFSSARVVLLEKLQRNFASAQASVVSKADLQKPEEFHVEEPPCDTYDNEEDMQIETKDDHEPVFITLDEELGIQLRVRPPRLPTPPIDELAKALSSVLQSPFLDDHSDEEVHDVEMTTIDERIHEEVIGKTTEPEENPFLDNPLSNIETN